MGLFIQARCAIISIFEGQHVQTIVKGEGAVSKVQFIPIEQFALNTGMKLETVKKNYTMIPQ